MAENGARTSEPLTRRDMAVVIGVLTILSVVVGAAGNWLFYSRTEGRVLEERVSAIDRSLAVVSASTATVSQSQSVLAKELATLQQRELNLAELIRAIQEDLRKPK